MRSQSHTAGTAGQSDYNKGFTSTGQTWVRRWSHADWSGWMSRCREERRKASGPLKRATIRQRAELRHCRLDTRVVGFVTAYEAHCLITRLQREQIDSENWRSACQARGEWRGQ